MPRKTITANVSLPPEIHAWVKAKIAAILEVEPAANPTFTSVVSQALRLAMNEEKQREMMLEENTKLKGPEARNAQTKKARSTPSRKTKEG